MNFKEACSTLGIAPDASADEAKKKYRELTKKYHPDVNKASDAEEKFKKINEAYQRFQNGDTPEPSPMSGGWGHASNPFSPFGRQVYYDAENIDLYTTISFKESVLGCKKEMNFQRQIKCHVCDGKGEAPLNNGCAGCGGKGQVTGRRGNMIFIQTCSKCNGRTKTEPCKECNSRGLLHTDACVHVSVPAGVVDGNILRLQGMGNFTANFMGMDQYTDAFLHITVTPEPGLSLEGKDVVTTLSIPLLDALQGCKRDISTINGLKEINVNPLSKNKEEVVLRGLGVAGEGDQRVILDVQYPKDTTKLVEALKEK